MSCWKRTTMMSAASEYILMDFDTAKAAKFKAGIDKHRNGDSSREFHGELCEEAYQECLDLHSYLERIEKCERVDMGLPRALVRELANSLRRFHERHCG